jgi:hypothetical protein
MTFTRETETDVPAAATYVVRAGNVAEAARRVEKANRRLARAGVDAQLTYTLSPQRVATTTGADGVATHHAVVDLNLSAPVLCFAGWTFVATLVQEDAGFIVRTAPGQTLNGWTPTEKACDHCGTNRARKDTYVVRNTAGQIRQVGSNCLAAFLGITPAGLWLLQFDAEDLIPTADTSPPGSGSDLRVPVRDTLAYALAVSDRGVTFVTRAAVEFTGKPATVDLVKDAMMNCGGDREAQQWRADMHDAAQTIITDDADLLDHLLDLGRALDGDDDYAANMRVACSSEWVDPRTMGLLVSIIAAWQRAEAVTAKEAARAVTPKGWLAAEGVKILDVAVIVTAVRESESYFGNVARTTTILTMTATATGHELKWFAAGVKDFRVGDGVVIMAATVKKHDTYRGVDQTVITRAKIAER